MTTVDAARDPWATLDDLLGIEIAAPVEQGIGPAAFYGRCSTEDNQDPATSLGWQLGNARKFIEPLGGVVAEEFFDIGQSRSVPWERRHEASRLLAALKRPDRGWSALVVGEGTRCWFGNQFSLIAPRFAAYGVDLWVPELGGRFDARNPSHKMLMSLLGGMSESERQHVQARVRAAMDAQVLNEGRHQGGRAPYGYVTVDGGEHPNPRKAAEGYRLRVLTIEEASAEVVRRIFAEYLDGNGDRAIANALNRDDVPCPSARRPDQNRHRLADGWQGSTVRAILDNPRYTGYAIFGRWARQEMLLDPDDVAAGHVTRFRRAAPQRVVRSRYPAHPQIVTVVTFTQAQLLRRSRAAGGLPARRRLERGTKPPKRPYVLRGCIRCAYCTRKMEGTPKHDREYYRCVARTLAPGSPMLASHPTNVYLPERAVLAPLNAWVGQLFDRKNIDQTVADLLASQPDDAKTDTAAREAMKKRLEEAEARLRRLRAAIEAGVDPPALVEAINEAQAQRAAARAELDAIAPAPDTLSDAEVYAMIDSLGDIGQALNSTNPESMQKLYQQLRLEMTYHAENKTVDVAIRPLGGVVRVSEGGLEPPRPLIGH